MQPKPSPHNSSLAARRTRLAEAAATAAPVLRTVKLPTKEDFIKSTDELIEEMAARTLVEMDLMAVTQALGWIKGQLLNVRNTGPDYVVTLFPEEFDPRYPERALRFQNPARCQDFVSKWYAREHQDPRAF